MQIMETAALACVGAVFVTTALRVPFIGGGAAMGKMRYYRYAHRGLHDIKKGIAENTLPAFERAVTLGFGSELDVHLTKDGKLAVIHDSDLERLCGKKMTVEELDYEELCHLDILGTGMHAPLLGQVLELYGGRAPLIVEVKTHKGNHSELCQAVDEELKGYKGEYCVESFDPRAVRWFKVNSKNTIRGQLSADFLKRGQGTGMPRYQKIGLSMLFANCITSPHFVAYKSSDMDNISVKTACKLFKAGLFCWTVRSAEEMYTREEDGAAVIFEGFVPPSPTRSC